MITLKSDYIKIFFLPNKGHSNVIFVVFWIVRVSLVNPSSHEGSEGPRLIFRLRFRRYFDTTQKSVSIVFLGVSGDGKDPSKEGEVPDVDEGHRDAGVEAEDPDTGERCDNSGKKAKEVRQGRHSDGNSSVTEAKSHSFRNGELELRSPVVWRMSQKAEPFYQDLNKYILILKRSSFLVQSASMLRPGVTKDDAMNWEERKCRQGRCREVEKELPYSNW